jgi:hypothetical protein
VRDGADASRDKLLTAETLRGFDSRRLHFPRCSETFAGKRLELL